MSVRCSWSACDFKHNPGKRTGHSLVSDSKRVLLFGGGHGDTYYNDVWSIDVEQRVWTKLATKGSPPALRAYHTSILTADSLYVIGGDDHTDVFGDVKRLDLKRMEWFKASSSGIPRRTGSGGALMGNMVYVFGGGSVDGCCLGDMWAFDLLTNTWNEVICTGDLPAPRVYCRMVALSDRRHLLLFGGTDNTSQQISDVHLFDTGACVRSLSVW